MPTQPKPMQPGRMMPGKIALLELLKQEGVRVMFGNPGTTELPLMDAFAGEPELRYVLALQEAPAMGMADGLRAGLGATGVREFARGTWSRATRWACYATRKASRRADHRHRRSARSAI